MRFLVPAGFALGGATIHSGQRICEVVFTILCPYSPDLTSYITAVSRSDAEELLQHSCQS